MILFLEDWDRHPTAIVDTTSSNTSWLRMAWMYRDVFKLKNWQWPLALHNPLLQGVDPHSPTLTEDQKTMIIEECADNPWYFFREVALVPAKIGFNHRKIKADRSNLATWWCFFNHLDTGNVQLRQTGKTIKIEYLLICLLCCMSVNTTFRYGTKDNGLKKKVIEQLKKEMSLLPPYIYSPVKGEDKDNYEVITNAIRNNTLNFSIGQPQEFKARGEGRGYTTATQVFDEVAETKNSHYSIPASLSAGRNVRQEAKEKGEHYGNVFACTAGSLDTPEGEYYYNLVSDGIFWSEYLLDAKDITELYEWVRAGCRDPDAPIINCTFSHRQLGISDEQLKADIAASRDKDPDQISRDYYSRWTRGGRTNPLTKEQLNTINNSEMEPLWIETTKEKYRIHWYVPKEALDEVMRDGHMIISLDSSNAVGKDFCAITYSDIRTLEVLGRFDISRTSLLVYGQFLANELIRFPRSLFIPENKSSGQPLLDIVIAGLCAAGEDPMRRIFNQIYQNPNEYKKQYAEISRTNLSRRMYAEYYDDIKELFGFMTNGDNRKELFDMVLHETIRMAGSLVRDRVLSGQLKVLETRKGRVNHPEGGHDDAAFSWLLGSWFAQYGKNFQYYGINPRLPLSMAAYSEDGYIDETERRKQIYRKELIEIFEEVEKEYYSTEGIMAIRLEQKLKAINDELVRVGGQPRNLEQLMESHREKKRLRFDENV